ncbi:MAG TPA: TadE family protein [Candidatus Limnocylindria bacterium]|nr:TadE family protein [Candidatus Limnocylindria bacterium]
MPRRAPFRSTRPRPALPWAGASRARNGRDHVHGQAMVEFALVLLPVLLLIVAIVQFGLLFGANVTLKNAVREGARAGTIYVYDHSITTNAKFRNDARRCGAIVTAATQAFGMLTTASPNFSAPLSGGECPTPASDTLVNGDVTVSYCSHVATPDGPCPDSSDPDTTCTLNTREACLVRVTLTYRSDVVVPLIGPLIGTDADGRFAQRVSATMVVN